MTVKKRLYVFKTTDEKFVGIEAFEEQEAREIAEYRNQEISDLVRVEEITIYEGEK